MEPTAEATPFRGFETAFSDAEQSLVEVANRLAAAAKVVSAGRKAAATGDVAALARSIQSARASVREADAALNRAGGVLLHDYADSMRAGNFGREIVDASRHSGLLGVRVVHGVIFSFPVVVTPLPDKLAVRIGKRLFRMLRPSAIVKELDALRKRKPSPGRLNKLVDAIERAYGIASAGRTNIAVKIRDVYDNLTPLPEQKLEYSELDFVADLYALERENILETGSNRIVSFPASTGTRGGNAIRVATENGEERLYSSIRFD